MSTTNFNSPNPAPYNTPNNEGGNQKRLLTIAGIAIALLLGTTIFLAIGKYKTGQQLDLTSTELAEQKTAFAELDTKYNEAISELNQQKGLNAELDAKINEQIQQLTSQKGQIEQMIREKKSYKSAIASLEQQKTQYLAEIDQLKAQVGILTESNTRLTSENQTLTTNLTETKTQLDETNTAKAALISEKTQLEAERTVLNKKVDIASAVAVKNVQIKSIDVRKSGKEREKSRAGRVDKLSICFTTIANDVVAAGEETFYLTITDPTGQPLIIESLGSGVSRDKKADSDFRYTTTATCNYQNGEQEVCGAWQPGQNFVKGKYTVDIFNKGYKVGSSSFNLK